MTQLYVGNLSDKEDEKSIQLLFGKYGTVCKVTMKSGYAFVELEQQISAVEAMKELNGSVILGSPMIVEPSIQQRLSTKDPGTCTEVSNTDFPLRIVVPSDMLLAIISKDKIITKQTNIIMLIDIGQRDFLEPGVMVITIVGLPECCTESCYQIMKIMPIELMRNGMIESGKFHKPLSVYLNLKILAHNELIGLVIGKSGRKLKQIMALSETKIKISRQKSFQMERTISIWGTIDNCKKAESLISGILRASYESYMAQLVATAPHPTPSAWPGAPDTRGTSSAFWGCQGMDVTGQL